MPMNGTRWAILVALAAPVLTGCGTLSSTSFKTGVNGPTDQVAAAFDATGGQAAWQRCRYFEVTGVVAPIRMTVALSDRAYLPRFPRIACTLHLGP